MIRSLPLMGTIVTIHVVGPADGAAHVPSGADQSAGIERAFDWFRHVEACCTRFDPDSELMRLIDHVGVAVPVSDLLFEAVRFAVAVAGETGGAFDPTVGHAMERRGFNRHYLTDELVETSIAADSTISYRDVRVDPDRRTVTLDRPLVLDLGAVAKGLAIDMAARELRPFENFAIDAGGDLYLAGHNPDGEPWSVGIRHPRMDRELIDSVRVSNAAVCTSGDYERPAADGGHHILDPRTGASDGDVASVTVIAPTAMVADALATAAFVMGPADGLLLLERQGVDGLIVSTTMACVATQGMHRAGSTILSHA